MNFNSLLRHKVIQARTLAKTNQGRNQQGTSTQWITDSKLNLAQPRLIASFHPLHPLKMPWKQATQEYCCSYQLQNWQAIFFKCIGPEAQNFLHTLYFSRRSTVIRGARTEVPGDK